MPRQPSIPDADSVPPPSGTSMDARISWCEDMLRGPLRHVPARLRMLEDQRVRLLEEQLGRAPNLATGAEGTGAFGVLARQEAARLAAEQRVAYFRGIVHGIVVALPALAALLAILRVLGVLRGP